MRKQKDYSEAVKDIEVFLAREYSYTEYMKQAAEAQTHLLLAFNLVDPDRTNELGFLQIAEFFYYAIRVMELLEPFTNQKLCV